MKLGLVAEAITFIPWLKYYDHSFSHSDVLFGWWVG